MPTSDEETRVLNLERLIQRNGIGALEQRVTALAQCINQLWTGGGQGCQCVIFWEIGTTPFAQVTIRSASDGFLLWQSQTNGVGEFINVQGTTWTIGNPYDDVSLGTFPNCQGDVSTTVDIVPLAPLIAARWNNLSFPFTGACNLIAVNMGLHLLSAAPGFIHGVCLNPFPTTLHMTDSIWGPVTLTWNGVNYVGTTTINYPGWGAPSPPCASVPGVVLTYLMNSSLQMVVQWKAASSVNRCPNSVGPTTVSTNTASPTGLICPTPTTAFSVSHSISGAHPWSGATATFTTTE